MESHVLPNSLKTGNIKSHVNSHPWVEATSAADGCRDAAELVVDNLDCPLANEMARWHKGGHPERSFARHFYKQLFV